METFDSIQCPELLRWEKMLTACGKLQTKSGCRAVNNACCFLLYFIETCQMTAMKKDNDNLCGDLIIWGREEDRQHF